MVSLHETHGSELSSEYPVWRELAVKAAVRGASLHVDQLVIGIRVVVHPLQGDGIDRLALSFVAVGLLAFPKVWR